jgi:outer membrane lipoprotein SlyB
VVHLNTNKELIEKFTNTLIAMSVSTVLLTGRTSSLQVAQGCNHPNYAAAIVGGVVGGVLGSTIGRGVGKGAAEIVGAGTGAIAGSQVDWQLVLPSPKECFL